MRQLIFVICFSFAVLSSLVAHATGKAVCDTLCQDYKAAHATSRAHVKIPLVCIQFRQDKTDNVVMMLYDQSGREIRKYAKTSKPADEFCIGRQWLEKVKAGKIDLCNGKRTEVLSPKHITILLISGIPKGSYACLYGAGKCDKLTKVVS